MAKTSACQVNLEWPEKLYIILERNQEGWPMANYVAVGLG